jgi:hypothetical protein
MLSTMSLHICYARGHYIGQLRRCGYRRWKTVTGKCKSAESAIALAAKSAKRREWKRLRVLFIDSSGWYEPNLIFEGKQ